MVVQCNFYFQWYKKFVRVVHLVVTELTGLQRQNLCKACGKAKSAALPLHFSVFLSFVQVIALLILDTVGVALNIAGVYNYVVSNFGMS